MATSSDAKRCAHGACTCHIQDGDDYCSEACRKAAVEAPEAHRCQCGHAGCLASLYVPPGVIRQKRRREADR